jgi:hypothetical protein
MLLLMLLSMPVNSVLDLFNLGVVINSNIAYSVSPDFFPVIYSLITHKGDCFNFASLYSFVLNIKGVDNKILKVDTDGDSIFDHAVVEVNYNGCFVYDLVNLNFSSC